MDYEKKYKELVGKIKRAYLYFQSDSTKTVLEEIFPELKESDDERIRKALIENFKWFCGDFPETTTWGIDDDLLVKDIIAWLEKQGVHKPAWSEEDEQTFIKSVEALEDFCKFELADWLKEHKKQLLKPHDTWKPSDEQMKALDIALRSCIQIGTWEEEALKSLKEQLMELRQQFAKCEQVEDKE